MCLQEGPCNSWDQVALGDLDAESCLKLLSIKSRDLLSSEFVL